MPEPDEPDVSLVILSWNTLGFLRDCLLAVRAGAGDLKIEVIVIDNASKDGSADMVAAEFPECRLVRNSANHGYAPAVNQGLKLSRGSKICLLGSDTVVAVDALPRMAAFLDSRDDAGAVAPRLLNFDGTVQHACMRFPSLKTALYWDTPLQLIFKDSRELRRYQMKDWDHRGTRKVDQPPGTCLMIPRSTLDRVGLMDERLWLFFNDVDWALRMRKAGLSVWYLDDATVKHHLGGSTRHYTDFAAEWHRNRVHFYRKHFLGLGTFVTKSAVIYVALRQCWRIRRDLPTFRELRAHCAQILKTAVDILRI